MSAYTFLLNNWSSILFILLAAIALVIMLRYGARKQVNEILFYLVVKAEKEFGSGTGELKFASVVTWLYERIPAICRWLFTKKQIDDMIELAVTRMKEYLNKNSYADNLIKQK